MTHAICETGREQNETESTEKAEKRRKRKKKQKKNKQTNAELLAVAKSKLAKLVYSGFNERTFDSSGVSRPRAHYFLHPRYSIASGRTGS